MTKDLDAESQTSSEGVQSPLGGVTGGLTLRIPKPDNWQDFERLCYQLWFCENREDNVHRYGREGQKQKGVDLLVVKVSGLQDGIQCKHVDDLPSLKPNALRKKIEGWVREADKGGLPLRQLVIVTTSESDTRLIDLSVEISDARRAVGKFSVTTVSWTELETRCRVFPEVMRLLTPLALVSVPPSPSAESILQTVRAGLADIGLLNSSSITQLAVVQPPSEHLIALNGVVVAALDRIRDAINSGAFADAKSRLIDLQQQLPSFEPVCQSRWHSNYGSCLWAEGNYTDGAKKFLAAFDCDASMPSAWANKARALCILESPACGADFASEALAKFPDSEAIWSVYIQASTDAGNAVPAFEDVPVLVRDSADVLMAYCAVALKDDRFEDAQRFGRLSLDKGPNRWGTKRLLLVSCLFAAAQDRVTANIGQLDEERRAALQHALDAFEPLDKSLALASGLQHEAELRNNIAAALHLLGRGPEALRVVEGNANLVYEVDSVPLAIRLFTDFGKIAEIQTLLRSGLKNFPIRVLLMGFEVAIQHRDNDFAEHLRDELLRRSVEGEESEWLSALDNSYAVAFEGRDVAFAHLEKSEARGGTTIVALVTIVEGWIKLGEPDRASAVARRAVKTAMENADLYDAYYAASAAYRANLWRDSIPLYERLLIAPGDDEITYKLLVCYVQVDNRAAAQSLLDKLPASVRELRPFRQLDIQLRLAMADWPALRMLLSEELATNPTNISIALNYAGTLDQLSEHDPLKQYLDSDPVFPGATIQEEVEFAKTQLFRGTPMLGVRRMYKRFRRDPESVEAASNYLLIALFHRDADWHIPPSTVTSDCAVMIRLGAETRTLLIESVSFKELPKSVDVVSDDSKLSVALLGKIVGETVLLDLPGGEQEGVIEGILTVYSAYARKAQSLLSRAIERRGPLWSVRITKDDGSLDIDAIRVELGHKSAYVQGVLQRYAETPFPATTLSNLLGIDDSTLWLQWPKDRIRQVVCRGNQAERDDAVREIVGLEQRSVVIDLLTLAEIVSLGLLGTVTSVLGRPLIARPLLTSLRQRIHLASIDEAKGVLYEQNGQIGLQEVSEAARAARLRFLTDVERAAELYCEVVPVVGPMNPPPLAEEIKDLLDDNYETLMLCLERDAILLTEDAAFARIAELVSVRARIWIQPLLIVAKAKGAITQQGYATVLLRKISGDQSFISLHAHDLLAIRALSQTKISSDVQRLLEYLGRPTTELRSALRVCMEFLLPMYRQRNFDIVIASTYFREVAKAVARIAPSDLLFTLPQLFVGLTNQRDVAQWFTPGLKAEIGLQNAATSAGFELNRVALALVTTRQYVLDLLLITWTGEFVWEVIDDTFQP